MKKYLISLKSFIAFYSSLAFGVINFIVCFAVCMLFYIGIGGKIGGFWDGVALCAIICLITMALNFTLLYFGLKILFRPIKRLLGAITAIANGDFEARAERKIHRYRTDYVYMHELDELVVNVNKMAQKLQKHEQLQKEFVSNVSHEMKTPISSIAALSEMIGGGVSEERAVRYAASIGAEANRLSKLCTDMLKLTRLDSGAAVRLDETVRIDEQLRQCIISLSQSYGEREFELDLSPLSVRSNAGLLNQIWRNLIENALKYSQPSGKIFVRCCACDGFAQVIVKDEGIGISREKLDKIFDRFYQCEESHKELGSGLGLSIVRTALDLLGGQIEYESEPGTGTEARVKIPL